MATPLFAPGLEGVRRWVSIGPLLIHLSSLLAPVLLMCCAMLARSRPLYSTLLLLSAQALHLLQPDAGQATAFGVAALLVSISHRRRVSWTVKLLLLAAVCMAWVLPDPLGPAAFVEDIIHRAFSVGVLAGFSAVVALFFYATSPLWSSRPAAEGSNLRPMLATYFALTAVVSAIGEFPVPLVGYGPSPLIGAFLSLAFLARAERVLIAESSTSTPDPSDVSSDFSCRALAFCPTSRW